MKAPRRLLLIVLGVLVVIAAIATGPGILEAVLGPPRALRWDDVQKWADKDDYRSIRKGLDTGRLSPVELIQGIAPFSNERSLALLKEYAPSLRNEPVHQSILIACLVLHKRYDAIELIRELESSPDEGVAKQAKAAFVELGSLRSGVTSDSISLEVRK